jgi:hypothetical protein
MPAIQETYGVLTSTRLCGLASTVACVCIGPANAIGQASAHELGGPILTDAARGDCRGDIGGRQRLMGQQEVDDPLLREACLLRSHGGLTKG